MKYKISTLLLAIFLILFGLIQVAHLSFEGIHFVVGGLAIAAGIFILLDK